MQRNVICILTFIHFHSFMFVLCLSLSWKVCFTMRFDPNCGPQSLVCFQRQSLSFSDCATTDCFQNTRDEFYVFKRALASTCKTHLEHTENLLTTWRHQTFSYFGANDLENNFRLLQLFNAACFQEFVKIFEHTGTIKNSLIFSHSFICLAKKSANLLSFSPLLQV